MRWYFRGIIPLNQPICHRATDRRPEKYNIIQVLQNSSSKKKQAGDIESLFKCFHENMLYTFTNSKHYLQAPIFSP